MTATNVLLCLDRRITCYDLSGEKRREWVLESVVRYIKVVGGLAEREVLLVGLRNGSVMKIFVDNAFPVQLVKLAVPVRCLDLSCAKNRLAVVDDNMLLQVYQLDSGGPNTELLFTENGVNAVSWNCDHEEMICYTGNGNLYVRTGSLPPYQQKLQGFVVGFKGNKVFCLHYATMTTVDVPHSYALHRCIERKDFAMAHEVACLGVTEDDWRMLGMQAMTHLSLDVARKAFMRVRDVKFVELLNRVELDRRSSGGDDSFLLGDVMAFQGRYRDAATAYLQKGLDARAIEMYCDLKMWDDAKKVCGNADHLKDLVRRQARWAENTDDIVEAAKLYLACGDYARAIQLMGQRGAVDQLIDICRTLPKTDVAAIAECGKFFREYGNTAYALEAYEKIGAHGEIVRLHVDAGRWQDAFRLLDECPERTGDVYVAYAGWLAMNDRYDEAQEAFKKADRPKEAVKMMSQLAQSCTWTRKYEQAAYYYFKLAEDMHAFTTSAAESSSSSSASAAAAMSASANSAAAAGGSVIGAALAAASANAKALSVEAQLAKQLKLHTHYYRVAEYYYAYDFVYSFLTQPFSTRDPTMLFHCAQYLVSAMTESASLPSEIDKVTVLLALSRLAPQLGMLRLSRQVHERLQQFVVPAKLVEITDVDTLLMRGKPFHDREELLIVCPRCGQSNPSLPSASAGGDRCANCLLPFVRCWASFAVLPLVEFVLDPSLRDSEAELILSGLSSSPEVIQTSATARRNSTAAAALKGQTGQSTAAADVITFTNDDYIDAAIGHAPSSLGGNTDPFSRQMLHLEMTRTELLSSGGGGAAGAGGGAAGAGAPVSLKPRYTAIHVSAAQLRKLAREDVFVATRGWGLPNAYYRNMNPRVAITMCHGCNKFFRVEDFEFSCMKRSGACPFCRTRAADAATHATKRKRYRASAAAAAAKS